MKKIFLILFASFILTSSSFADNECRKYNNVMQQKEYKECLAQNPTKESKKGNKLMDKINLEGVKNTSKKVFGKLNTDSKLTDFIKKKMGK